MPLQIAGIVAVLVGVFLVSSNFAELKKSFRQGRSGGVSDALVSMVAWGITYTLLRPLTVAFGPIMALLFLRIAAISILFSWSSFTKTKITTPTRIIFLFFATAGLLDLMGFVAFNNSISTVLLSMVGPIAATAPAVTVLLAYFFLQEKVVTNQKIGIIAILIGLVLISLV